MYSRTVRMKRTCFLCMGSIVCSYRHISDMNHRTPTIYPTIHLVLRAHPNQQNMHWNSGSCLMDPLIDKKFNSLVSRGAHIQNIEPLWVCCPGLWGQQTQIVFQGGLLAFKPCKPRMGLITCLLEVNLCSQRTPHKSRSMLCNRVLTCSTLTEN